jgi:hypothetical protein
MRKEIELKKLSKNSNSLAHWFAVIPFSLWFSAVKKDKPQRNTGV